MGSRETERERERYAASLLTSNHSRSYRTGWNLPSVFIINLWKKCGFVGLEWKLETRCGVLLFLLEIGFLEILFFLYYSIGRIFFNF